MLITVARAPSIAMIGREADSDRGRSVELASVATPSRFTFLSPPFPPLPRQIGARASGLLIYTLYSKIPPFVLPPYDRIRALTIDTDLVVVSLDSTSVD